MKEVHLSDGAMTTMREDLAEAIDREPMVLCWAYVSKALDEIEWLREQWFELRCITKERDAALGRVEELEAAIGAAKDMAIKPQATGLMLRMEILGLPTKHSAQESGEFIRIERKEDTP